MDDTLKEAASAVIKVAPPTVVTGAITMGHSMDDWIKILTIVYIAVQITALIVSKFFRWKGLLKGAENE